MTMDLQQIAAALGSNQPMPRVRIESWCIDSRDVQPASLFFALRGPNNDGHDFLGDVFSRGAAAAVIDREVDAMGPVIVTSDTLNALQRLASYLRSQWTGDMIGIAGSAGKTTTKDVIAHLLSVRKRVGKTSGNFNNHVGLPLSILRIPEDAEAAVIELGMNHAGEIRELAKIARPRIGVVTNVGWAHIQNFESQAGIALAKRELIEALPRDGVAVLNADDPAVSRFAEVHPGQSITFGIDAEADVRATNVEFLPEGARFRAAGANFESPLPGRHGVLNILAGIAVARRIYGIPAEELSDAVKGIAPGKMRGERLVKDGVTIWNDCYNSNPDAARSMVTVLRDTPARRRIAVLGEMLELGRWSEPLHRDIGRFVAESGVSMLIGIRGEARSMVEEAVSAGLAADAAFFFENPEEAGGYLREIAKEGDAILFKGSRGTRVEKALERFMA
jgi:UDP-N-acetylmuramoyl-tripeptide--D-alanyl-D-alanine ligase